MHDKARFEIYLFLLKNFQNFITLPIITEKTPAVKLTRQHPEHNKILYLKTRFSFLAARLISLPIVIPGPERSGIFSLVNQRGKNPTNLRCTRFFVGLVIRGRRAKSS